MPHIACDLEFGSQFLHLRLPPQTALLALPRDPALSDPAGTIRQALAHPLGAPPLAELARRQKAAHPAPRAAIVVSDNTRPVPYKGPSGILLPVIETLRGAGIHRIDVLVANGTHRPLAEPELRLLLPGEIFDGQTGVYNHSCTDDAYLRDIGNTPRGARMLVNTRYLDADIKILTGLVEPHFMAGASGGAKSICPGIAGEQVTRVFHGPELMDDERSASLNFSGNPCYDEALAAAKLAGVDFIVNVTLNGAKELTGVFAGGMLSAHQAAVARLMQTGAIRIPRNFDLVITHGGFAGINHYQAAKAAAEAVKAARPGGTVILAANHTDVDPVGGPNYRRVLPMLKQYGPAEFVRRLRDPAWQFIPEQWEAQMWCRVFRKLGSLDNLIYCAPRLTGAVFRQRGIPGRDGGAGMPAGLEERALAEAMVQRAADAFFASRPAASAAVLLDGPYGVPVLTTSADR